MAGASSSVGGRSRRRAVSSSSGGRRAGMAVSCRRMRAPTNGDGTGRGPWLSAALIGGAVAGAVCGVIVMFLGQRDAGSAAPRSTGDEALVRELRTLATEMATLRDELERMRLADTGAP